MKIKLREKEGMVILDLEGNIDINASNFVETVGWTLNNKSKDIICNFEGVNLIDYVGVSLIAVVYKNILNQKGTIKIYNVPSHVMKFFAIVGLDRIFEYYMNEEQAINAVRKEKKRSRIMKQRLRRRFKRIPLKVTVEYKQKFSSKDLYYEGRIINLSGEGIFVTANKIFPVGETLLARINLKPGPGIIETEARVVWVVDKEIQAEDFPGMGLAFPDINHKKQEQIVRFVERHLTRSTPE